LCIACTIKEWGRGSERYSGEIAVVLQVRLYAYIHTHYILYDFDAKDYKIQGMCVGVCDSHGSCQATTCVWVCVIRTAPAKNYQ
jgi:hypothetical protein